MLRFTKRADYGLMAIHFIASHGDDGAVSAKRIAEEFRIPPERLTCGELILLGRFGETSYFTYEIDSIDPPPTLRS